MATDLTSLRPLLDIETGSELDAIKLQALLIAGVHIFNAHAGQSFTLDGTAIDRDATSTEQRAIILFATLAYLDEQIIRASKNAVVVSDVAGKTDLSGVEFALSKRRKELFEQQITPLMKRITGRAVIEDISVHELGETLELAQASATLDPWIW